MSNPGGSRDKRLSGRRGVERRALFLRANPLCIDCKARGILQAAEEVDHIVALANGGADDWSNLAARCAPCHRLKTADDLGFKRKAGADSSGMPLDPKHPWNSPEGGIGVNRGTRLPGIRQRPVPIVNP